MRLVGISSPLVLLASSPGHDFIILLRGWHFLLSVCEQKRGVETKHCFSVCPGSCRPGGGRASFTPAAYLRRLGTLQQVGLAGDCYGVRPVQLGEGSRSTRTELEGITVDSPSYC